jgi:phytoene dehydrogenase-like protein
MLDVLLGEHPSLRGRVEHAELSTPLSTRNFAGHPQGEIYGLAHVPARFEARALRPQTRLPGLYLTGADLVSAGVAGALLGGTLAAVAVAGREMLGSWLGARRRFVAAPAARRPSANSQAA